MVDQSWEGTVSEATVVTVEGDPLRGALDLGWGSDVMVPPVLPATWWQQVQKPWLSKDLRLILREQSVDLRRPLVPGEQLSCTVRLERVRRRGGYQYLTTSLEARSGDTLVARAVSLLVVVL